MTNRPPYEVSSAVLGPFATLLAFMMFAVEAFSAQANPTCESLTGKAQFAMNLNEIQRLVKCREFPAAEQKIIDLETAWIIA